MEEFERAFIDLFQRAVQKVPEARTWNKVYQFNVEGQMFYIEIKGGAASVKQGSHPSPIATLSMSRETLSKILRGELDAMKAFMSGQLKITGNVFDTVNLKKIIDAGLGK
ncbi:MAG: SCP2 sterol-binding domain-containing protein [Acidilobaceae archaeon]|nr:SCP2 sterol-binding domain-containing protein [Acidilobaceae archaeon]MCX8165403.1 SCP2 sterol-binding domain-containing protein [Acidilobaceae archaeon]MDW7973830.1 SCP2 sterol-binding domain-containing protein [Sulfolobales archaeon]